MKKTELFKIARAIFGFCIVLSFGFSVKAGPISFGTHYYEFVYAPLVSWETAREAATTNSFMGVNGHLAVILSGAENDFLRENFATYTGFAGAWLGGLVDSADTGYWQVGPAAGLEFSQGDTPASGAYANWGGIEPNNAPSAPYMNIGTSFAGIGTGQWADAANGMASGADPVQGYFVEYEFPVPAPVLRIAITNATPVLQWTSVSDVTYLVQISTNLNTWTSIGSVTATGTNSSFTDENLETLRFYRLMVP